MTGMTSKVLSLRLDSGLFDRLHDHAAKRGMSVQDYVVRTLVRDDFDERFHASVERTERFYGSTARAPEAAEAGRSGRRPPGHGPGPGPEGLTSRPAPARSGGA